MRAALVAILMLLSVPAMACQHDCNDSNDGGYSDPHSGQDWSSGRYGSGNGDHGLSGSGNGGTTTDANSGLRGGGV